MNRHWPGLSRQRAAPPTSQRIEKSALAARRAIAAGESCKAQAAVATRLTAVRRASRDRSRAVDPVQAFDLLPHRVVAFLAAAFAFGDSVPDRD